MLNTKKDRTLAGSDIRDDSCVNGVALRGEALGAAPTFDDLDPGLPMSVEALGGGDAAQGGMVEEPRRPSRRHDLQIATLIATIPTRAGLLLRALETVAFQTRSPDQVVVVFDGAAHDIEQVAPLVRDCLRQLGAVTLMNERPRGAAGAWNTGLTWLGARRFDGYVAILDDDDEWDVDHLEQCASASGTGHADIVISGLRFFKDGVEQLREPLNEISRDDFLAGNPGWQGSNTFVKIQTLQRVGGFTDGLASTNDRDLAVRLLSLPELSVAFTGRMTASWHVRSEVESVSKPGSPEKCAGLRQFFQMHGHLMSPQVEARFRRRARDLFEVEVP